MLFQQIVCDLYSPSYRFRKKLCAICDANVPQDAKALRSFLDLNMFYNKFLNNQSTVLSSLNKLLCKDQPWCRTNVHDNAFQNAKKLLIDSPTFVHCDDSKLLYMLCDASAYGCGGELLHRINGSDRSVSFTSCTLTKILRNYSPLDKEAFSIICCLKRFHQFLYGRLFHIIIDHKPLLQLLGEHNHVPIHTTARIQHYSLILASYNYKLEFCSTKQNITSILMRCLASLFLLHSILCQMMSTATSLTLLLILIRTVLRGYLSEILSYPECTIT